jgi:carbonic anhydrase
MTRLIRGAMEFQRRIFGSQRSLFGRLAGGQKPPTLFVTCSDSRINPNLLTQTEPGELFILRNAGNLVPPHGSPAGGEAATVEYAVAHLKVQEIVVCGHSHCGAVAGLLKPEALEGLPAVAAWLAYGRDVLQKLESVPTEERMGRAIEANVLLQLEHLRTHPAVAGALAARALRLHGWVYHFETGDVRAFDPVQGRFVPLSEKARLASVAAARPDVPRGGLGDSI